jgi:hypothetical protein
MWAAVGHIDLSRKLAPTKVTPTTESSAQDMLMAHPPFALAVETAADRSSD